MAGDRVGIYMPVSPELLIGLLAILKAGAGYVWIDPKHSPEHVSFLLQDTHAEVLLTLETLVESLTHTASKVVCVDAETDAVAQQSEENPRRHQVEGVDGGDHRDDRQRAQRRLARGAEELRGGDSHRQRRPCVVGKRPEPDEREVDGNRSPRETTVAEHLWKGCGNATHLSDSEARVAVARMELGERWPETETVNVAMNWPHGNSGWGGCAPAGSSHQVAGRGSVEVSRAAPAERMPGGVRAGKAHAACVPELVVRDAQLVPARRQHDGVGVRPRRLPPEGLLDHLPVQHQRHLVVRRERQRDR